MFLLSENPLGRTLFIICLIAAALSIVPAEAFAEIWGVKTDVSYAKVD